MLIPSCRLLPKAHAGNHRCELGSDLRHALYVFRLYCTDDDDGYEVDHAADSNGGECRKGIAVDQDKRRMIHTEHDCAHDACCDEKLHGMDNIHRIASVFIEENQIQNSRHTEVRIRRPCCAEHAPRRDGGEIPGEEDLHTRRKNHVQERDRGLTHPLQHACRDLLHTEQEYAEAHDGDTRTGIAGSRTAYRRSESR